MDRLVRTTDARMYRMHSQGTERLPFVDVVETQAKNQPGHSTVNRFKCTRSWTITNTCLFQHSGTYRHKVTGTAFAMYRSDNP